MMYVKLISFICKIHNMVGQSAKQCMADIMFIQG